MDVPFDTDHRLIKGKMISWIRNRDYKQYMRERKNHGRDLYGEGNVEEPPTQSDNLLKELKEAMNFDIPDASRRDNSWILDETFNLLRTKKYSTETR